MTECAGWILLDYFEDAETATRKLFEREIELDRGRAADLLDEMARFAERVREAALICLHPA